MMSALYVFVAFAAAIIMAYVFLRKLFSWESQKIVPLQQEINELKAAKASLETRLAVEEQKAGRIHILEAQISDNVTQLVSVKEAKASLDATLSEKKEVMSALQFQLDQVQAELKGVQLKGDDLSNANAALREIVEQERKVAAEKLALLTEAKNVMTQEFKLLADNAMKTHGENFSKQNKEQIDALLNPLKEKLGEFNQGIQTATKESNKERTLLAEQIRALSEASAKMTTETTNLTKALKGDSQTQGAWGEMILSSILERSGLREGQEYTSQEHHASADGGRVRTDVVVNIPGGQKIIIDSKVSLVAFELYVNALDDSKGEHLDAHLASLRSHIKSLSKKEYQFTADSHLDYVIMFVPIEGALAAALQSDPALTSYAVEKNVAIATPTTLMMALRTVANVWQVERRNQNAEIIAQRAGRIYDKLVGFIENMRDIGRRLDQAKDCYTDAMSKLHTGKGNLISQADQLKGLGAKTSKSLPLSGEDSEFEQSRISIHLADNDGDEKPVES